MPDEDVKDVVVDTPDEGFGDAFAEAAESKPTDEKAEVKDKEEIKEEKKEEEKETPPPEKSEKPEEKVETPESLEQKYKTLQGMYNQLKEDKAASPEKKEEGKEKEEPPPDFTPLFKDLDADLADEIKAELAEYDEEYDHIAKFEGLKREQLAKRLIALMNVSFDRFRESLQPYLQATKETAQSTHYTKIKEAHPDFEDVRNDVKEWIESKPKYLREPLKKVYASGDTEDVIGMFQQFKDETGRKTPTNEKPTGKRAKDTERESNLELVKTKEKGIPPAPQKPSKGGSGDEFSQAFAEASNK